MRSPPKVSVVVPFYDAEPYIERCIRGLFAQELPAAEFEILMVDNNSTDRSAEIVARYPRIRLLHEPKQGAYAARNHGIREARGEVLVFTDPDCVPEPQWLPALLTSLADPDAKLAVGRVQPGTGAYALRLLSAYEHHRLAYVFSLDCPSLYFGYGGNMAVRRDVFESIGCFVENRRGGDTLLVIRAAETFGCDAVRYVPEARTAHLEIDSLRSYLQKLFLYGQSQARFSHIVRKRPVTARDRLHVLRRTLHSGDVSRIEAIPLVTLLATTVACSHLGEFVGARAGKAKSQAGKAT